jgi:hypothetical protein
MASMQAYFNNKKVGRDDTIAIEGTNSMTFNDYGKQGSRGIKSWEKARYENWDKKAKQQKFYDEQRQLQQIKNRQFYEAEKAAREQELRRKEEEEERIMNYMKEVEKMNRVVVHHSDDEECNDAW